MTQEPQNIGRPRSFDETEVIDRILPVFFEHGYQNTSFPKLEEAAGLHRQSLRYAFRDKRGIFLAVLERYGQTKLGEIRQILSDFPSGSQGLSGVFDMWLRDISRHTCRGCLLVSSSADRSLKSETQVLASLNRTNQQIICALESGFATARNEGELASPLSNRELASQMLTLSDGVMALCHIDAARDMAPQLFNAFLHPLRV